MLFFYRTLMQQSFPYQRVVVTGGAGFLGSYVVERLRARGAENIFVPRRAAYDLVSGENVRRLYDDARPDLVIHLAAIVGGIGANRAHPGRFFYDNLMMGAQLMEEARLWGVKKFVALGTICFTADAFIKTGNKYKTIADITVGETVESRDDASTVLSTLQRRYTGTIVEVKPYTAETLTVTPEHPFLVKTESGTEWVEAGKLRENDLLFHAR